MIYIELTTGPILSSSAGFIGALDEAALVVVAAAAEGRGAVGGGGAATGATNGGGPGVVDFGAGPSSSHAPVGALPVAKGNLFVPETDEVGT